MKLILDVNEKQKHDFLKLANRLKVPVEEFISEEEVDRALCKAIQADFSDDVLSLEESKTLMVSLLR